MEDPQYPDDSEHPDGTVELDENDQSEPFGVPSVSTKLVDRQPGGPEMAAYE